MTKNRLGSESSPYLRQHKDNPVHWYPWGDAAFSAARSQDKPILLSVGYAACHWCHVMAHESFEDAAIARRMNADFINVKVDREERPDVDSIYQTALQLLGERGGWPLTMFLTPAGEPFWGGTYFPQTARYGRPGFDQVLDAVATAYAEDPERVRANVDAIRRGLDEALSPQGGGRFGAETLSETATRLYHLMDPVHGGTRGAPKFPQPMLLRVLWWAALFDGNDRFRNIVTLTLERMCQGGIYDHLGGGFARYSTDERWLVPHFEKMLYDNALLIELMSDVWLADRRPIYAARVAESIDWLVRDMAAEHDDRGNFGFASALDADSEGEEGKYYVWEPHEIVGVLGDDAPSFSAAYDVTGPGNWEDKSILNRLGEPEWSATDETAMAPLRRKLLARRAHRIAPSRDGKVLADWNGLAIAALARAGQSFGRNDWIHLAERVFNWVVQHMTATDGRLRHARCDGRLEHPAVLDDYANLSRAALVLFEITGVVGYLAHAESWTELVHRYHHDPDDGGYVLAATDTPGLIANPKPISDNAQPAGNGVMAEVLARLFLMTGRTVYQGRVEELFQRFAASDPGRNVYSPSLVAAWTLYSQGTQVVIVGALDDADARALADTALRAPDRATVVTRMEPGRSLSADHPAAGKGLVDGRPAAYICIGPTCGLPLTDPAALDRALKDTA